MKLFHTEDGKEKVWVQMEDIMHVMHQTEVSIPASIVTKIFSGVVIVTDEHRFDFVKFEEEAEVKFFKDIDYILDYNQYKDLSDEQMRAEGKLIAERMYEIAEKWNQMPVEERHKQEGLYQEFQNLEYKMTLF